MPIENSQVPVLLYEFMLGVELDPPLISPALMKSQVQQVCTLFVRTRVGSKRGKGPKVGAVLMDDFH